MLHYKRMEQVSEQSDEQNRSSLGQLSYFCSSSAWRRSLNTCLHLSHQVGTNA